MSAPGDSVAGPLGPSGHSCSRSVPSIPSWFTPEQHAAAEAALDRLIPADDEGSPGARAAGAADYVDGLLGAFLVDPPRIWAGGPFSGRHGGEAGFEQFLPLGPMEEWAWRTRIDALQAQYREGLARLGDDFVDLGPDAQDARLDADPAFKRLLYVHACEGTYGDPVYGGNRDLVGWTSIGFDGDSQPRGWTDDEVSRGSAAQGDRPA